VFVVILAVMVKAALRIRRKAASNENLDFSGFADPSSIGSLLGSFAVFIAVCALFFFLWKLIGIVRVFAACYLVEMSIMTFVLIIGGVALSRQEEASNRRHEETLARMRGLDSSTRPGFGRPGFGRPGFERPGGASHRYGPSASGNRFGNASGEEGSAVSEERLLRPMGQSEIRIVFMHRLDTDLAGVRDAFLAKAGNPNCQTIKHFPTQTHFVVQRSGDLAELAELIDFGRVAAVNEYARVITVVPQSP
jgi:hypothetical protein